MLWESQFYEDGVQIAGRIHELVPEVDAEKVAALAVEAREQHEAASRAAAAGARDGASRDRIARLWRETLARVIQRADELAEFVAIYWADGRQPLSAQVKKGLAAAFRKFDEYALAKYDRAGRCACATCCSSATRSRGTRRRPRCGSGWSRANWRRPTPGRWRSPGGADKREAWERLLASASSARCPAAQPAQHAGGGRERGSGAGRAAQR